MHRNSPQPADANHAYPAGGPPWLWLWAALLIANLPGMVSSWVQQLAYWFALVMRGSGASRLTNWLMLPANLMDLVAYVALLVGLLASLFPEWRARHVEKRLGLKPLPAPAPALLQPIEAYCQASAPRVSLWINLLRTSPLAFVYPRGIGRTALGLSGAMVMLWKRDEAAGRAVLAHELAHARRGDAQIVGLASPFEQALRLALRLYPFLVLIPLLLVTLIDAGQSIALAQSLGSGTGHVVWRWLANLGTIILPGALANAALAALQLIGVLGVPILLLWAAELAADHTAATEGDLPAALALTAPSQDANKRRGHRLDELVSHPPLSLRQRLATSSAETRVCWLALAWPLAQLARLVLLHLRALLAAAASGGLAGAWSQLGPHTIWWLQAQRTGFGLGGLLALLWPLIWRLWSRDRQSMQNWYSELLPGLPGAVLCLTLAAIGWLA